MLSTFYFFGINNTTSQGFQNINILFWKNTDQFKIFMIFREKSELKDSSDKNI